jgi:hypothetical protein
MVARSMICRIVGFAIAGLAVACADPKSTPGTDSETGTTATLITWSDGKPAISISCSLPGDCQNRALAMCKGGNYTTLKMDNMPTAGDARVVRGSASVVVRCSS